ncbi:MAG: adenosine deaminase [Limnochordales bacterium]
MDWTSIPKVELHLHLDGSVRPGTLWELLEERRRRPGGDHGLAPFAALRSAADVRRWMEVGDQARTLAEYLSRFELPLAVMQDPESMERIAYELVEDAARENVRYMEVRFAPILHTREGMTMRQAAEAAAAGLQWGGRAFGVGVGVIACCMRHVDPADNVAMVREMEPLLGRGVVAVDLAGDEAAFPGRLHREAFDLARAMGFNVIIHAGEASGAEEIRYALETLGARRIGHGVALEQDPELMRFVVEEGIPLEMCPSSNVQTKAVAGLERHPLRRYFDAGVRVTVNTDNRTVSAVTLADEYERIVEALGFTADDVRTMIRYAAEAAFLPGEEKARLIAEVSAG